MPDGPFPKGLTIRVPSDCFRPNCIQLDCKASASYHCFTCLTNFLKKFPKKTLKVAIAATAVCGEKCWEKHKGTGLLNETLLCTVTRLDRSHARVNNYLRYVKKSVDAARK